MTEWKTTSVVYIAKLAVGYSSPHKVSKSINGLELRFMQQLLFYFISHISFGFEPIGDRGVTELASALKHNESMVDLR